MPRKPRTHWYRTWRSRYKRAAMKVVNGRAGSFSVCMCSEAVKYWCEEFRPSRGLPVGRLVGPQTFTFDKASGVCVDWIGTGMREDAMYLAKVAWGHGKARLVSKKEWEVMDGKMLG